MLLPEVKTKVRTLRGKKRFHYNKALVGSQWSSSTQLAKIVSGFLFVFFQYCIYKRSPQSHLFFKISTEIVTKNYFSRVYHFGRPCGYISEQFLRFLVPHCYFTRLNLKKMGPIQFCLSIFLGIHRNPKQKDFF